jgi:hypothetical protein
LRADPVSGNIGGEMKIRILLFLLLFFYVSLIAQNTWIITYQPFNASCYVCDILVCTDGGFVVNGYYNDDYYIMGFVMKANSEGNMLWAQDFDLSSYWWEHDMVETLDNGIITTGFRYPTIGSGIELIKIDSVGNIEWEDILENYHIYCLDKTSDGNIIAAGYNTEEGYNWPTLVKLNQDIEVIWSQSYTFANYDYGRVTSAVQSNDEGYLLIGELTTPPHDKDIFVIKTNAYGDSLWSRIYGNDEIDDEGIAVIEVDENNILVSGYIAYTSGILWKLDNDGNTIWFYETPQEVHKSFSKSNDGSIISLSGWGYDSYINKFNSDYNIIWSHEFLLDPGNSDKTLSTTDDDYIVLAIDPNYDIGIAKLNSEGFVQICDEIIQTVKEANLFAYPNPFNPSTTIEFSIQNNSKIDLSIFNIKGQKIKTLSQNEFAKGNHSIVWNGDDDNNKPLSSGVYLCKLNVNGKTEAVKKCLLLK